MRPPRPWPSWRRAMSRLIASRSRANPAGRPSTTQVRPGPWLSPAVTRRRDTPDRVRRRRGRGASVVLRSMRGVRQAAEPEAAGPRALDARAVRGHVGLDEAGDRVGRLVVGALGLLRRVVDLDDVELVLRRDVALLV